MDPAREPKVGGWGWGPGAVTVMGAVPEWAQRPPVGSTIHPAQSISAIRKAGVRFFDIKEQTERSRLGQKRNYQRPSNPANRRTTHFGFSKFISSRVWCV